MKNDFIRRLSAEYLKGVGFIKVRGARVHNLKNIDVDIPKNKLVVITGVSGSGKSSLAFDTLYAEGQRRYVESLSAYARQFLGVMQRPDVDRIENISPAIAIDQRKGGHNPRSTVGTITEIYDYLRLLFARLGQPHCPKCGRQVSLQTVDQIVAQILALPQGTEITILAPVIEGKKGEHRWVLEELDKAGFIKARVDAKIYRLEAGMDLKLDRYKYHRIEAVVDRLAIDSEIDRSRLSDSLEVALKAGKGKVIVNTKSKILVKGEARLQRQNPKQIQNSKFKIQDLIFSEHLACAYCGISLPELEPRLFSFNSPYGACPHCQGLGEKLEVDSSLVIPHPELSLAEGAIRPWARASHKIGRQGYFWWQLSELAREYDFSLNVPFRDLPKWVVELILYGANSQIKNLEPAPYRAGKARSAGGLKIKNYNHDFEGVIPWLERRYHETESEHAREEIRQYMVEKECEVCEGKRLRPEALAVRINGRNIHEVTMMPIGAVQRFFEGQDRIKNLKSKIQNENSKFKIAAPIIKEIVNRLQFLTEVGLDYLTLSRKANTLSGGEEERVRLATQIGSQLSGVLYILDEPSVGLHARDQHKLIKTLKKLRDLANTIIVVEHDPQTIRAADWVIDIGPGAGKQGGKVVFEGRPEELAKADCLTGDYLSGRKEVTINPKQIQNPKSKIQNFLEIKGAQHHNLKNITVKIPLGKLVCVSGVSGSGKSTLVDDILARALMSHFYKSRLLPGRHKKIEGLENLDKAAIVDQSPIGRTPRSNPVTYTGAFSIIRDLFARTYEARSRGFLPGRFSFNVKGGRCEVCEGQGFKKVEMYFLPDAYVECQECRGSRYNKETLQILYRGKNINEVLKMTVQEALEFFKNIPGLRQKLGTLQQVGLGYVALGQPAPTLSGGEAQRVKLAAELSKKATGRTLYILDEPTTGLHFDDVKKLLQVLRELVHKGNTVLIIEHQLDVIGNADWVIDLGPEGGDRGGEIVAEGTPSQIAQNKKSYTGRFLKSIVWQ